MQFQDPIASGNILVREALQSPNYVTGNSGWSINSDGSAEFNDAVIRGDVSVEGEFSTGTAPAQRILLTSDPFNKIYFYSGDPDEDQPGEISGLALGTMVFKSGVDNGQLNELILTSPDAFGNGGVEWTVYPFTVNGQHNGAMMQLNNMGLRINPSEAIGLGTANPPLQIGTDALNMILNPNVIQGRANGVASGLYLNWYGGARVHCGGDFYVTNEITTGESRAVEVEDDTTRTTVSTGYSGISFCQLTIPTPRSGKGLFIWSALLDNTVATESTSASIEVRDTNVSGTVRLTPHDDYRIRYEGTAGDFQSAAKLVTTMNPAAANTFIRLGVRSSAAGNTASISRATLAYIPVH